MAIDVSRFIEVFFDETEEQLASLEQLLLALDLQAPDAEVINAIFRIAHSIKGGAGSFGFVDLIDIAHGMESMLGRIRRGDTAFTTLHREVFLQAKDVLKMQLDGIRRGLPVDAEQLVRVRTTLAAMAESAAASPSPAVPAAVLSARTAAPGAGAARHFQIVLPGRTTLAQWQALCQELPLIGELTPAAALAEPGRLLLQTRASADEILSLCAATVGRDGIDLQEQFDVRVATPPLAEHAATSVSASKTDGNKAELASAGAESSSIRVNIEKIDLIINLVGELVITEAMLAQRAQALAHAHYEKFLGDINQLSRNTRDLQAAVMSVRMMPMDFAFSRFPRMVHELSNKLGKNVNLVMEGNSTELDKGLIEKIIDPLTHLLRNSIDHGIETPALRLQGGKNAVGQLKLSATHQGGLIVLEVQDDGAGLNRERILATARASGHQIGAAVPDEEVWQLIFLPGLTTAEVLTDVSGRGVGMDVVKRSISSLGGTVTIFSKPGMGTRTRIALPLTLAILDGMSVRVGGETYMLPLTHVMESFQPRAQDIRSLNQRGLLVLVRGDYLPVIALADVFGVTARSSEPASGILVVVSSAGRKAAFWVDELVTQQQVVVKNIETNYRKVANISGATILGDGSVALIVDVAALLAAALTQSGTGFR